MHTHRAEARLVLKSQLQDVALVWPWLQALSLEHAIPADTQFAINLCLEEALSNVIRHGYAGEPNNTLTVNCIPNGESWLTFIVEDGAPHYAPFGTASSGAEAVPVSSASPPPSIEDMDPGGQGIPLMKRFAGTLAWEPLPKGNRLKLGFQIGPPPSIPA